MQSKPLLVERANPSLMSAYPITAINTRPLPRSRAQRRGRPRPRPSSASFLPLRNPHCDLTKSRRKSRLHIRVVGRTRAHRTPLSLVELLSVILYREICSGISQLSTSRRGWLFWPWVAEKLISCPDTPLLSSPSLAQTDRLLPASLL